MIKLFMSLFALLILASPAWAHGTEKILNQDSGNYTLSLSYDPFELGLGGGVPIGFNISPKSSSGTVDFTSVYVKITPPKEADFIFAAPISKSEFGETSVLFKFPGSGDYKISASFRRGTDTIAETDFVLNVSAPKTPTSNGPSLPINKEALMIGLGGIILGYGLSLVIKKK